MEKKIHYKSVDENQDYILIKILYNLDYLLTYNDKVESKAYEELQSIYFGIFQFERNAGVIYKHEPIALKKDSELGKYILSHPEIFIDDDKEVTYDKVVSAYNVATFEDNAKMANKILPLFQRRISGNRDQLSEICNLNVLDFILKNGNFKEYLDKLDGKVVVENKEYIVYEDDEYSRKILGPTKGNVKVKNIANG